MSRRTTLPPRWAALAAACGGVEALAEACDVSQMTIWRWARGTLPHVRVQEFVSGLAAERGLADPWADL